MSRRAPRPKDVIVKRGIPAGRRPVLRIAFAFLLGTLLGLGLRGGGGGDRTFLEDQCLTPATLLMGVHVTARSDPWTSAYFFVYRNQTSRANEATQAGFDDRNTTAANEAVPLLARTVDRLVLDGHLTAHQGDCAADFLRMVTP